jgi:hypothetical protein
VFFLEVTAAPPNQIAGIHKGGSSTEQSDWSREIHSTQKGNGVTKMGPRTTRKRPSTFSVLDDKQEKTGLRGRHTPQAAAQARWRKIFIAD